MTIWPGAASVEPTSESPVVVLGDCHVAVGMPEHADMVARFLRSLIGRASRVILLGDFFDFWLGPKHLLLPDYKELLSEIRVLTDAGMDISMVPGNRDFLVDEAFVEYTGIKLLDDCIDMEFQGKRIRLTHGDLLCTHDWRYRIWRSFVRASVVRSSILHLPLPISKTAAILMRRFSQSETKRKAMRVTGFVKETVEMFLAGATDVLIVGHNHRPEIRKIVVDGREKLMYVLGDWKKVGIYITLSDRGIQYHTFPPERQSELKVPIRVDWNTEPDWTEIDRLRGTPDHRP